MPIIELPDGQKIEFPDTMDMKQIETALNQEFAQKMETEFQESITPKEHPTETEILPTEAEKLVSGLTREKHIPIPSKEMQETYQSLPGIAGGIVGGIVGAAAGHPIKGAMIGGALGKAASIGGERLAAPAKDLESIEDIGMEIAKEGAFQGGLEVLGRGAVKAFQPFAKYVTPEAKTAIEEIHSFMPIHKEGPPYLMRKTLTPGMATEHQMLDWLDAAMSGSMTGGQRMFAHKRTIDEAGEALVKKFLEGYGERMSPTLIGKTYIDTINKRLRPSRLLYKPMMNKVENLAPNMRISTGNLKKLATDMQKGVKELGAFDKEASGDTLAEFILKLPDEISFPAAKALRTKLIGVSDTFSVANPKAQAIGKSKKLLKHLHRSMRESLRKEDPEALALWQKANQIYREGSETFDNAFLRGLKKHIMGDRYRPHLVAEGVFKDKSVEEIKQVRNSLKQDPKVWEMLQNGWVYNLFKRAEDTEGNIVGKRLLTLLEGRSGMGTEGLNLILEKQKANTLKRVATTLSTIQAKAGSHSGGGMVIQLTQAGAIIGLATSAGMLAMGETTYSPWLGGGGLVVFAGPYALARMLTNPMTARWLTQSIKLPPGSPAAGALLTKLGTAVYRFNKELEGKEAEFPIRRVK